MTRSTPSTPICNPQLPPVMAKNAGALQPLAVRHVATPRPFSAPNTKPPLIMCGTTAMHFACSEYFFRNALVRRGHDFVQHFGCIIQTIGG